MQGPDAVHGPGAKAEPPISLVASPVGQFHPQARVVKLRGPSAPAEYSAGKQRKGRAVHRWIARIGRVQPSGHRRFHRTRGGIRSRLCDPRTRRRQWRAGADTASRRICRWMVFDPKPLGPGACAPGPSTWGRPAHPMTCSTTRTAPTPESRPAPRRVSSRSAGPPVSSHDRGQRCVPWIVGRGGIVTARIGACPIHPIGSDSVVTRRVPTRYGLPIFR
jgi:hypothetical protein